MDERSQMLKSKFFGPMQEVVLPDFPDDDSTVTTTVTKSRRVSFGTNFIKEFIVGSAVSAKCVSEYEQAFSSSDSSIANSSNSAVKSGIFNQNTFVLDDIHKEHEITPPEQEESQVKRPKISSTICFSADSPTTDMEFTEGCISLAKNLLVKKNKEMTVFIQAKPKESKDEVKTSKDDETKYFEGSQFDMSMTKCFKSKDIKKEEKKFESEKTKIFNKYDDEMSITRCDKLYKKKQLKVANDDESDASWEDDYKENQIPLDLIMHHLDKDNSDLDKLLFNPEKSLSEVLNANPFDNSNDSEKLNMNESMDISTDFQSKYVKSHQLPFSTLKMNEERDKLLRLSRTDQFDNEEHEVEKTHDDMDVTDEIEKIQKQINGESHQVEIVQEKSIMREFEQKEGIVLRVERKEMKKSLKMTQESQIESIQQEEEKVVENVNDKVEKPEEMILDVQNKLIQEQVIEKEGDQEIEISEDLDKDKREEIIHDLQKDAMQELEIVKEDQEIAKIMDDHQNEMRQEEDEGKLQELISENQVVIRQEQETEWEEGQDIRGVIPELSDEVIGGQELENAKELTRELQMEKQIEKVKEQNVEIAQEQNIGIQKEIVQELLIEVVEKQEILKTPERQIGNIQEGTEIIYEHPIEIKEKVEKIQKQVIEITQEHPVEIGKDIERIKEQENEMMDKETEVASSNEIEMARAVDMEITKEMEVEKIQEIELTQDQDMEISEEQEIVNKEEQNSDLVGERIQTTVKDAVNLLDDENVNLLEMNKQSQELEDESEGSLLQADIEMEEMSSVHEGIQDMLLNKSEANLIENETSVERPIVQEQESINADIRLVESRGENSTEVNQSDRKPSLVDIKVIENLNDQSKEPRCMWTLKDVLYPMGHQATGLLSFNLALLDSWTTVKFSLKGSNEDSLNACSSVLTGEINLGEEDLLKPPEYKFVVNFGFEKLKKNFEEERKSIKTVRHMSFFLDQMNLFVIKINACLRQVYSILTLYPGSKLNGYTLSFRLFSFPLFFSSTISIDLSDLCRCSKSSISFNIDFGSLDKNKLLDIFQECLKCENSLIEFVVRSTRYLIGLEQRTGCVSKRGHIRLLPEELKS